MRREERELSTLFLGPRSASIQENRCGEKRESCRPRIWVQGPHQSKRTDAERRERVVDPGSGPKVRISPRELMRREERELSTQDLGPRSESSDSTGSDKKGMCSRGPCISSFSIFTRPVSISSSRPKALSQAHSSLIWDSCNCSL